MHAPHIAPASACSYPRRGGNFVRPLIDGIPAFRAISEAVASARHSVWVTVAFLDEDLAMPDGRGSFFDVLEGAASRGLDVRVLFWSEPEIEKMITGSAHFPACERSFEVLSARAPHVLARWDRLRGYCHHQKSWLVDAATDSEVAFVGGINLDHDSIVSPGHPHGEKPLGGSVHDVYAELRGPSASDVHHNFVQRWNEASERGARFGAFPSLARAGDLGFPSRASREAGQSLVQVARTVKEGAYRHAAAAPGAGPFSIEGGETSILEQYMTAIDAAQRTIYLENQILLCPELFTRLGAALARGVDVVAIVPVRAMPQLVEVRYHPQARFIFEMFEDLAAHDNFFLAALGATREDGSHADIYVHAKVAVIDDQWATIGSANAMFRSFRDDTELNVTVWDRAVAGALRADLLAEHLGATGSLADDRAALASLRERALDNRERLLRGQPLDGQVHAIEARDWALPRDGSTAPVPG